MAAHEECSAKRLDYIAARVADVESDVLRLRRGIDHQIAAHTPTAKELCTLIGQLDQIRATLIRARDTCEALLADEAGQ
jgi:hypothetical protein